MKDRYSLQDWSREAPHSSWSHSCCTFGRS